MIQRIYRITFLLFVIAGAIRLSAQTPSSEVGVWIVDTQWNDTAPGTDNIDKSGRFDENVGYGISFNHYWTEHFSTELSAQRFSASSVLGHHSIEGETLFNAGEVDVTALAAMLQWHFNRDGRFAPYLGMGAARMAADFSPDDDAEIGPFDFKTETAIAGAVGADVRITPWFYFSAELKFIPWNAAAEGSGVEGVDVDPLVVSAGAKVRF
jgi:outer membrane protein W